MLMAALLPFVLPSTRSIDSLHSRSMFQSQRLLVRRRWRDKVRRYISLFPQGPEVGRPLQPGERRSAEWIAEPRLRRVLVDHGERDAFLSDNIFGGERPQAGLGC